MNDPGPEAEIEEDPDAVPICLCCLAPLVSSDSLFCQRCGAPVDSLSAVLPYERILAQGFLFRTAVERPRNWRVVAGIWFLFGPASALVPFSILLLLFRVFQPGESSFEEMAGLLVSLGVGVISLVLLIRVTRGFLGHRKNRASSETNPA